MSPAIMPSMSQSDRRLAVDDGTTLAATS